jgi:clan AA aspartic protease
MGTFSVAVRIGDIADERSEMVEALVDTGSSHLVFPSRLLREVGIEPFDTMRFRLADERVREFPVGTARMELYGRMRHTTVAFGDDSMQPLLGAISLEDFGLAVDPVGRRLIEVGGLLMTLDPR